MEFYFLKIEITEFIHNLNLGNINTMYLLPEKGLKQENKEMNYEIVFDLVKSKEKYLLEIINDNNGNKIPFTNYFTLSTSIKINKNINENIDYDFLEISLYNKESKNEDKRKLIDIAQGKLIDENCIKEQKYSDIKLGNFNIKFTYKLLKFEDLYKLEPQEIKFNNDEISFENSNTNNVNGEQEDEDIIAKYHNIFSKQKKEEDIIYDESLFQEIEPIDEQKENDNISDNKNNDLSKEIYHKMNSKDFFDINVDIFEEDEKEEEENNTPEKEEKNPFESANKINTKKIYRNTHMSSYEIIHLEQPILKEIIKDNLIECFLISGLSKTKKIISNSESYFPQCKHKNCLFNNSYNSQIFFKLQKPNSIFEEMEQNLISNLIFPYGIKICFGQNFFNNLVKKRSSLQFKNADFSFNVLTDIKGKRYYIYSLIFFIKFEINEFNEFYEEYNDIEGINNKLNNIFIPFSFSIISKFFDIEKFNIILKDLFITFNSSELQNELFDNQLIHLIFEIPAPPINSKLKLFLPNSQVEIYSNIYENKNYKNIDIFCGKYTYKIDFIIKIFILFILEKRIIFHSSIIEKIYLTLESFLSLIYPLKWVSTYITLIPDENINIILQSFLPFIIGMTHQMYFNYSNKIENINKSNDKKENKENWDNIFIINLDTENIMPTEKINDIIKECPIYEYIQDEYIKSKNSGEVNNENIKKIFFDAMFLIFGDYEKFISKLGENVLFNQKIFLRNKSKKYEQFYKEITSTQQFYQFINDINIGNENLYFEEFREKIKFKKYKNLRKNNNKIEKIKNIYIDDYYLYPYFFEKNKELESDLFNFEDEVDLYYNCLNKEHDINYLLETEAFVRIKLVLKNYVPQNLRKYEIKKENYNIDKNKRNTINILYNSNYDSNLSNISELDTINIKNIFDNFYGKVKTSINRIIPRKTTIDKAKDENKENISINIQTKSINNKIKYRHRNSLLKMIRENTNKKELLTYKDQIIDLLKDYMGYILSNQNSDFIFSVDELSKLLKYRKIRREFSKILYQSKFEKNIEHELSEETFELLYQSVFSSLININDDKNEYKTLRRIIKSLFYYFHKRKNGIGKIYLYQKFLEKKENFYFKKSLEFWKYYYKLEKIENEENYDNNYDESGLINKIKNEMFLIDVDDNIVNFFV